MKLSTLLKNFILVTMIALGGCNVDVNDAKEYTKPTVNAGSDKVYTLPVSTIKLSGSAKTKPKNLYSIEEVRWTQTSGPEQLAILNADRLTATLLTPTTAGTYTFKLYAKDSGGRSNADSVNIVLQENTLVSQARSSQSYSDDYQLMWKSVEQDQYRYPLIEDRWQALYQPYLVKAEQISSDEQWQDLITQMMNDLDTNHVSLHRYNILLHSTDVKVNSLAWSLNNGIGTITFENLTSLSIQELQAQINAALTALSTSKEIYLDFKLSGYFNDQLLLTLMAELATQTSQICLRDNAGVSNCFDLQNSAKLEETRFILQGPYDNKQAQQLFDFLLMHQKGEDVFEFEPSLPLTSTWTLD